MKYIFITLILLLLLLLCIEYFLGFQENYCKIPKYNRQGVKNDTNVDLTYKPQSNINNSNCDKYWKNFSTEYNSLLDLNEPIPIKSDQLSLPPTSSFGNKVYRFGLLDFKKLASFINNKNQSINTYKNAKKLNLNPSTKEKVSYEYQVNFFIRELNLKTDIKRFNEYNPVKMNYFNYIESPIPEVNAINQEFLKRINKEQVKITSKDDQLINGLMDYQPYSYRIIDIKYLNNNKNEPIYVIQMNLFQEYNYYINSFAYIGYIKDKKPILMNTEFIGVNQNSEYLNTPAYDKSKPTNFFILNKNFNDFQPRLKDINEVIKITETQQKLNALESNYACFNTDTDTSQVILNYDTKSSCESPIDYWGRPKPVGIYDKPCEKDNECPFYESNKNYKNKFGGCINGKCELPKNMQSIGYHFYSNNPNNKPLCYNCNLDNKKYNIISSSIDDCCQKQYDKKKFKNFKSPDYAFKDDVIPRINAFNQTNYKTKDLI